MNKTLWQVIKDSKEENKYTKSKKQYENLHNILSKLPQKEVSKLRDEWADKSNKMTNNDEFEKLHRDNGGIIISGDDGFYMDFASWVMAQGEELYEDFMRNGHKVILNYIKENNVSKSNYMFECMEYVFHDFADEY